MTVEEIYTQLSDLEDKLFELSKEQDMYDPEEDDKFFELQESIDLIEAQIRNLNNKLKYKRNAN